VSKRFTEDFLARLEGSIAVVGNGELARDFGSLIDGHGAVIRFNAFRIAGHEARCGRRTTHWCTFGETPHNPMPGESRRGLQPFSPFTTGAVESAGVLPEVRARMIYARCDHRAPLFPKPSTGILLLRILEELGWTASVFGFDGFVSGHYFDARHVHDPNHGVGEFLYLITRPCFRVYLDGFHPAPVIDEDPSALLDQLARGHRIL
jgi:hypothetical protein